MSVYTTELRYIVEAWTTAPEGSTQSQIIDGAIPKIFDFTFPIWDTAYLQTLEHKILDYYYFREIGFETANLWKQFLRRKLISIMPYYTELHKTIDAEYDFLSPYTVTESITRDVTNEGDTSSSSNTTDTTNSNGTSNQTTTDNRTDTDASTTTLEGTVKNNGTSNTLNSDLPQTVQVTPGIDYGTNSVDTSTSDTADTDNTTTVDRVVTIDDTTLVGRKDEASQTGTADSMGNTSYNSLMNENVKNTRSGNLGNKSYSELIQQYRDAIINIDMMIILDLEPLFMGLWM